MNKLSSFFLLIFLFFALSGYAQNNPQQKADIAFVLRGFDKGCFFCDTESFDVHAKSITEQIKDLSFGRVGSYVIMDGGIDDRSPIFLQSLRDIDVMQAALDGWPDDKWDWLRDRTDFWYVVPDEFRPIIEEAISWMMSNQKDFQTWGTTTELGKEHYFTVQTNVQRMGSSAAADYLLGMRMPEAYDPQDYGITLVILHSDGPNQIAGGGAASSLAYFGVQNSEGETYPEIFEGNRNNVAYVGATPINFSFYPIAVHEAIHSYGMGTHDQDPNGLVTEYSIMNRASLNSINSLPAWDRYYWTKWLSKETITTDSSQVIDLLDRVSLSDTIHKYILEVIPGDDQGRGGTYKELYNGNWYSYQVDAGGTLTFLDAINNEHLIPTNYILAVPETIREGEKVIFRAFSDGPTPHTYTWKKDGAVIQSAESNELVIDPVTSNSGGSYEVIISNQMGEINTNAVDVRVICSQPQPPTVEDISYCHHSSTMPLDASGLEGYNVLWYGNSASEGSPMASAPLPSSDEVGTFPFYLSQQSPDGCESERARILVTINPIPEPPVITLDSDEYLLSNVTNNTWFRDGIELMDTTQRVLLTDPGTYTAITTIQGCVSDPSAGFEFVPTGILMLKPSEHIQLYPNPFQDEIKLDFLLDQSLRINMEIFDSKGSKVYSGRGFTTGEIIALTKLEIGMYFVHITMPETGSKYMLKMVK